MKNSITKIVCLGVALFLMGILIPDLSVTTQAAEKDAETIGVRAQVVVPKEEVFSVVTRASGNGVVDGYGVRLRKKPSSSATILELMDNGEYVTILHTESTVNWYYLKRMKTGTVGYANRKYILAF